MIIVPSPSPHVTFQVTIPPYNYRIKDDLSIALGLIIETNKPYPVLNISNITDQILYIQTLTYLNYVKV